MTQQVTGYNGLIEVKDTLPASYYIDPTHYERELEAIWYKNWVYVCRADALAETRAFRTIEIGSQNILVLRDDDGSLQAFHNTCRHRGSVLVTEPQGLLRSKNIVCPYHRWTYSQQGGLLRTSSKQCPANFDMTDHSLYDVAVVVWKGFVFVNLAGKAAKPIKESLDKDAVDLDNWPLAELKVGETFHKTMECNWKIFWENFNECLHCPGVHKTLSQLVPIYRRAIMEPHDDPEWAKHINNSDPSFSGGLEKGAATWSSDGQLVGKPFPNLTAEEIRLGYHYAVMVPTVFIVAHADYVRIVRLMPLGPERTEIQVEWLFSEETLADETAQISRAVDFVKTVLNEDAHASELNQKGLRSLRHKKGTLMAEEYAVHDFQNWVRAHLGE